MATFLCWTMASAEPKVTFDEGWFGNERVLIELPARVPYRLAVVAAPPRLVVDVKTDHPIETQDAIVRTGSLANGWQRVIVDLDAPKEVVTSGYHEGDATLQLDLASVSPEVFARQTTAIVPWPLPASLPLRAAGDGPVILIDPGHGGIDPGAVRDGVREKDIALAFAAELSRAIEKTGWLGAIQTRQDDRFMTLNQRVGIAREVSPILFLSLHANTVTEGKASGVVVYMPSDEASDPATAALAALENRADGAAALPVDTLPADVRNVVLDLARPVTRERAGRAANALVQALVADGRAIRSRPLRSADFRVLSAPDVPSLLVELGFLSDPADLQNLQDPAWRAQMAALMAAAIVDWVETGEAELSLIAR